MTNQPGKPVKPPAGGTGPDDDQSTQAAPGGWHEPPVQEGSTRPVIMEAWYAPPGAAPEPEAKGEAPAAASLPPAEPPQSGAWYMPPDALLTGLADTIAEAYEEEPAAETQPAAQEPAETEAQPMAEAGESEGWVTPEQAEAAADGSAEAAPDGSVPADGEALPMGDAAQEPQAQVVYEPWSPETAGGTGLDEVEPPVPGDEPANEVAPDEAALAGDEPGVDADQAETRLVPSTEPGSYGEQKASPEQPPISRGLTPAEAAMLAESRRAAGMNQEQQNMPPSPSEPTGSTPDQPPTAQFSTGQPPGTQPGGPTGAPASPQPEAAPAGPSPYEVAEQQIQAIRQRFQAGQLTREQFQAELRKQMILGDDGHWWMLGLETDRWYSYDGREWKAGVPPGYQERVRGSGIRTETGAQQVVAPAQEVQPLSQVVADEGALAPIELDDDGMPLPQRVPQEDPGATLVSPSTPFLEPVRPSEARTLSKGRQVEPGGETLEHTPLVADDLPMRPDQAAEGYSPDATMRSDSFDAGKTMVRGENFAEAAPGAAVAAAGRVAAPQPQYKIGEFPQPDYSEALGPSYNRNTYIKWGIRIGVATVIGGLGLMLIGLIAMIAYYFYKVDQYTPAVNSLKDRAANFETTMIMDAEGNVLAEFNNPETGARQSIALNQISPWLIQATVATENETFYSDPGFSVSAIIRAVYQNLQAGATVSGGSTITQQLARALVLETEFAYARTTERKIVEVIVASEITRKYDKNEILQIYLNEIFYGNFAYGAEAAAQTYFHKSAADLNPVEAAFLAGLPQSPATYDPVVNREAALARMETVLRLMAEANGTGCIYIQHDDTTRWGVPRGGGVCIAAQTQPDGSVTYTYQTPTMAEPQDLFLEMATVQTMTFRPPEFEARHPHFVNYVWQQLEDQYGSQAIYSAGYRVYTTLNEGLQSTVERSVSQRLGELQARGIAAENASVVVLRPSDGAVTAMVGSADYNNEDIDGQVNVAFTAQQPGSTIKPIIYVAAFEPNAEGRYFTPATVLWDVYTAYGNYVPTNYDNQYHGPKSVREALGNSLNVPAVKTLNFVGLDRATEVANRLGVEWLGDPQAAGLSTALGAVEVRLFDMVQAYSVLANNGRRVEPYAILYIQDKDGNQIYQADTSPEGLQVVTPQYTYLITSILSDADARAQEFGYGWPMELADGRPAAVKTGTTNDSRDIWTLGYTPQYVVGVWVGNTDNTPMYGASGYAGAAPIWNDVMTAAHQGLPLQDFPVPTGIEQKEVCADTGAQPTQACAGRTYLELFSNTAPPPAPDQSTFVTLEIDSYTGLLVADHCRDSVVQRTFFNLDDPSAFDWINNTPEGQAWADQRGIDTPLAPPPTQTCPNEPRPLVVVSYPTQDATVQGAFDLLGTVSMPNFDHYELRYGQSHTPSAFSDPLVVDRVPRPDADSVLARFDSRVLQNGPFTLQLTAYSTDGRSVSKELRINVNNPQFVPAPTTAPTLTPQFVPQVPTDPGLVPSPTLAPTPLAPG